MKSAQETSSSYLTFKVGEEIFATHVAYVSNIIEVPRITEVPNASPCIKGVINLRGNVLPIIDTRVKLNLQSTKINALTCILVLEIEHKTKIIKVGILVDSVQEVIEINEADILPTPKFIGFHVKKEIITGIADIGENLILLLNLNTLLGDDELDSFTQDLNNENMLEKSTSSTEL